MSATIEIDVDQLLQNRAEEIRELKLIIKEQSILLTASTAREKRLMDGIRAHKEAVDEIVSSLGFGTTVCPEDTKLHKLLGEVKK